MIRGWSEDNPTIKSSSRTRRFGDLTRPILETHCVWKNTTFRAPAISQNFTKCCACHEKWTPTSPNTAPATQNESHDWSASETSFTMLRATLQLHQLLRLPRKVTLMIVAPHIWNVIHNARGNTGYRPTSPNAAPATKFWVQDVSGKSLNCFRLYKDDSKMIRG